MTWHQFGIDIVGWLVAALGGFMGAVFLIPTKLGEALFKFRFDKALEAFKGEQAKKLEDLRERLDHLLDRGKRSNELEFSATKETWEQFIIAYSATEAAIYNFMELPGLDNMTDNELNGFLESNDLSPKQRDQVKAARQGQKTDMFVKIATWRQISKAGIEVFNTHAMMRKNRIFISEELRAKFMAALDIAAGAQVKRKLEHQHPDIPRRDWGTQTDQFLTNGDRAVDELAKAVQERLFRDEILTRPPMAS